MNPFRNRDKDTDDIDEALNAYLVDISYPAANDIAAQTLDTHRKAMSAVRSDPAASGPAVGTWNRVLRATAQPTLKGREEMTTATWNEMIPAFIPAQIGRERGRISRFTNVAATLAIVSLLAFGGWFAGSYLQPHQGPEPRYAALGLQADTAGNGVCDVEPLSVDEAITILRDPLGSLVPDLDDPVAVGYPAEFFGRHQIEAPNASLYLAAISSSETYAIEMPQHQFAEAQPVINEYLDCMHAGTAGQEWRLMNPVTVQYRLASALPTLTSEGEARELLPEILSQPATFASTTSDSGGGTVYPRLNPDITQTRFFVATGFIGFSGYAVSPVQFVDSSGAVQIEADLQGHSTSDPDQEAQFSMDVIYGQSSLDLQWYVIDVIFPFNLPG